MLPVDFTSQFLGVLELSMASACLVVRAFLMSSYCWWVSNPSVVVGAWVFVTAFSGLLSVSEIVCHHHYHAVFILLI